MWSYEDKLQYPVNVTKNDLTFAKCLLEQIGGYAGELGACLRYLNQSFTMPTENGRKLLLSIGTEEMAHLEILSSLYTSLIKGASKDMLEQNGLTANFIAHGHNFIPSNYDGVPFSTSSYAITGDPCTDLYEDIAAEEKAKLVYDRLISLTNNQEILGPLLFLRQREIVHLQRFGELLNHYNQLKEIGKL